MLEEVLFKLPDIASSFIIEFKILPKYIKELSYLAEIKCFYMRDSYKTLGGIMFGGADSFLKPDIPTNNFEYPYTAKC